MNFYQRVYALVRRIPAGKCATYGQLALMLGNPRASRAVGYAMRACKDPSVPCHRVVRGDGSAVPAFGPGVQRAMLEGDPRKAEEILPNALISKNYRPFNSRNLCVRCKSRT